MGNHERLKFNWRGFVSLTTGLSFIGMCVTGIALLFVPPGRIANWTDWKMLGLTKRQWIGQHVWFSAVFFIAAILHIYLNWRPLVNYCKAKVGKGLALRWEWVVSLVLCLVVGAGTFAGIRPFSSLLDWSEGIKHHWDRPGRRAPVPHAELLTLEQLAEQVEDVDAETMIANLKARGIEVNSSADIVGEIAKAHNVAPIELYNMALGAESRGRGRGFGGQGRGGPGAREQAGHGQEASSGLRMVGQMTLREYCDQAHLDLGKSIEKLQAAGLKADADMTIRQIADSANRHPSEVRGLLE
ncbi:MAG: DUF4405 domain-containing protein [Phycisphaerales bacterium]|nr:MAG: DUF4405 domain-containing protein [Phycisphaerales bacterium]